MKNSAEFWDKKAAGYAKSSISDEQAYQRKLSETQALFSPEMRVLEFGCGTGATAVQHAPHVQHIDATDISENMLDIARTRAREANVENISFTCAALTELNAGAASYDAVLGLNIIHLLENRKATLAEAARVLKPGGLFVSSTACLGDSPLRFIKYFAPLGKLLGLMPDVYIFREAELTAEIEKHGFTIETQWHHGFKNISVFIIARKIV